MTKWNKLQNPEIFQGNKEKKSYFEGWYFKVVDQNGSNIYAIIPGIALDRKKRASHSFIQFFDGGKGEYDYFKFDVDEFQASEGKFAVNIGGSYFSSTKIHLDTKEWENDRREIKLYRLGSLEGIIPFAGNNGHFFVFSNAN